MRKYKKYIIGILAICFLCNFNYRLETIFANKDNTSLIEATFEEALNEEQSEADIKMNLTYDENEVSVNKIVLPDKQEIEKKEEVLLATTYHVIENNTYDFEVHYTNIVTLEEKQETFSYEMKTIKIEEEVTKEEVKEPLIEEVKSLETENLEKKIEEKTETPLIEETEAEAPLEKEEVGNDEMTSLKEEPNTTILPETENLEEKVDEFTEIPILEELEKPLEERNNTLKRSTRAAIPLPKAGMVFWNDDTKAKLNPLAYTSNQPWEGSKVYWGELGVIPMKWRILNTSETGFGVSSGGVLIMHDDAFQMGTQGTQFNPSGGKNIYMGSNLATYLDEKFNSNLNFKEQEATLVSKRNEEEYVVPGYSYKYEDFIQDKQWFAPTMRMMSTESYGYSNTDSADQTRKFSEVFWTSSAAVTNLTNYTGVVRSTGILNQNIVTNRYQVLSASQLNPNSILFVSNAIDEDGKQTGPEGPNAMMPVRNNASGEYKLTLKDTTQGITVTSTIVDESNLATIKYNKIGYGTKLSAIVTDKEGNNIISYGHLASIREGTLSNQTATVQLPSDFFRSEYKLKVFTEIVSGYKKTDYASAIMDADLHEYQAQTYLKAGLVFWDNEAKTALNPAKYNGNRPWIGSKLYWGKNGTASMKWRILNTSETGFGQSNGVLIMHDDVDQIGLDTAQFNSDPNIPNAYEYMGSDLETKIDKRYTDALDSKEQDATLSSSRIEENYRISPFTWNDNISDKKWFVPTERMMVTESYGFPNSTVSDQTRDLGSIYWLSSGIPSFIKYAGNVDYSGNLNYSLVTNASRVVGASQLDSNSILFVSNAKDADGKKTGVMGPDVLMPVKPNASGEYKLTLKDTTQTITVTSATVNARNLVTIKFNKTGDGTKLSAVVTDKDGNNIHYYGQLASIYAGTQSDQIATVQLPSDFFTAEYKLKVFTEIYNGNEKTDYASALVEVNPVLAHAVTFVMDGGEPIIAEQTIEDGTTIVKPEDPTKEGYRFGGWYSDNSVTAWDFDMDTVTADMTLYAKWDEIFHLSFDVNTGVGSMSEIEFIAGENVTLPMNAFTKENYTFAGWNTQADGKGTAYTDKAILNNMLRSNMTLYATWKVQEPSVYVDIPKGLSLIDDRANKTAVKEGSVTIVKNPLDAPWYPNEDIQIRTNTNITLTNSMSNDVYEVEVYKADGSQYMDGSTPLAILNVKDDAKQSSTFTLKTPMAFSKQRGTYEGIMNFTIEFVKP